MRVLVLGGAGFIGRHACRALLNRGHTVVVGSRHPDRCDRRLARLSNPVRRLRIRMEHMLAADAWRSPLEGVDVVLNCVGILRPRWRETYEAVHHLAVDSLGRAVEQRGLRLVHVSALGLHSNARSGFIRSKWMGEQALLARRTNVTIVRPSLLDGPDGFGARWLRRVALWPVHFVPAGINARVAPLSVDDLALALSVLCERGDVSAPDIVELGGPRCATMAEHLAALRAATGRSPASIVRVPALLARLASHACDVLHMTPFSFGHLELMAADNVATPNQIEALLGRLPTPVGISARSDPRDQCIKTSGSSLKQASATTGGRVKRVNRERYRLDSHASRKADETTVNEGLPSSS